MKLSRLIIGFVVILIIIYAGIIWWIQSGWQIKIIKRDEKQITNIKNKTVINQNKIQTFQFVNLGSKLLNHQHQLPLKLKINDQLPNHWRIRDFLNYYYPKWHNLYKIENKVLKTIIKLNNHIFYQPKVKILRKIYIQNITTNELKAITNQTVAFNKKLKIFLKKTYLQKTSFFKWTTDKTTKNISQRIYQSLRKQIIFKN